jgi:serine/threonine kinase 38
MQLLVNISRKGHRQPHHADPTTGVLHHVVADRQMEQRAVRAKELLSSRYTGLRRAQERKAARRLELEQRMAKIDGVGGTALTESQKGVLRSELARGEVQAEKESRRKITTNDFEALVVIGRGAFGEVSLVRSTSKRGDGKIFALKSMKKESMRRKNQTHHVRAEREALSLADDRYQWLTHLHHSFQDESNLYMVMDFMPGGDLMGLLIREDTFSEGVTRHLMAEAAHAISAIHALGYIHRDIKPDNFLIDATGHLKLTDLGLCKRIGQISPEESPTRILEIFCKTSTDITSQAHECGIGGTSSPPSPNSCIAAFVLEEVGDCEAYYPLTSFDDDDDESADNLTGLTHLFSLEQIEKRRARAKTVVGTPDYIAPEVLAMENGGEPYDSSVDWWSLGAIMYECLVGKSIRCFAFICR